MPPYLLFFTTSLLFCIHLKAQKLKEVCSIPALIKENSGMYFHTKDSIWLHNDSGDSSYLYCINSLGQVVKQSSITPASNIDWEDLAYDHKNTLYIGDFGNNANTRRNLCIYIVKTNTNKEHLFSQANQIYFHYPEQKSFPPVNNAKHYDTEAMIYKNKALYLFTKNRTAPYDGYTRLYRLPCTAGQYPATLIDSFKLNVPNKYYSITGAALSPDGQFLVLLNSKSVFLFGPVKNNNFFDAPMQKINLGKMQQYEAIDFATPKRLYISHETSILGKAKLKTIDISTYIENQTSIKCTVAPSFSDSTLHQINLTMDLNKKGKVCIQLYTENRELVDKLYNKTHLAGKLQTNLSTEKLKKGIYLLRIKHNNKSVFKRFSIL